MKRILSTYALIFVVVLILAWCATAHCQTVAPFMGVGNIQAFDNNGIPCTNCALYSFVAGTSTQQATYTDASGLIQNTNPITFGSGARAAIWLTSGALYKLQLCAANDGSFCAPSDVLFSVDQVPASPNGGAGGGGSPFTGTFISGSSTPATSGILRLASGDTVCYRNTANNANLCWRKDSNDLLSWDGGSFKLPEVGAPSCSLGFDVFWADSTAHTFKECANGGSPLQFVFAGADINTSSQVTQLHFGATGEPLGAIAPTTNQFLQWNGANIIGYGPAEFTMAGPTVGTTNLSTQNCALTPPSGAECSYYTFGVAHTLTRLVTTLIIAGVGCGPLATVGVKDVTSGTTLLSTTVNTTGTSTITGSAAIPAGDIIGIGLLAPASGCSTFPLFGTVNAIYQ